MQGKSDDFRKVLRVFIASPRGLLSQIIGRKKTPVFVMVNLTQNTRAIDTRTTGSPTQGLFFFAPSRLRVFVSKFNAKTQRCRGAKGVVNRCLHVLHAVAHQTDHCKKRQFSRSEFVRLLYYVNFWLPSFQSRRLFFIPLWRKAHSAVKILNKFNGRFN